jgi:hypothetical protein
MHLYYTGITCSNKTPYHTCWSEADHPVITAAKWKTEADHLVMTVAKQKTA